MSATVDNYLADLYRLEELEGWHLLGRHLELTEGFSLVVVLAPDDHAIAYLRSRLPELVGSLEAVHRVVFDPSAPEGSLAESLLQLASLPQTVRLVWVDADPVSPEGIAQRNEAWRKALARLNRHRNTLQASLHCTLALAGPVYLQTILREEAPDLWSIRSGVFRIEPVGSARTSWDSSPIKELVALDDMALPGDPADTLAEADKLRGKPGREILLAQLMRRAARQAFNHLQWDLALRCLQEAYALEEAHGSDPELRFEIANETARVFERVAHWERALHYCHKALEIAETHFGPSDQRTAVALNNLGVLLEETNRLAEAEPLLRRALAIDEGNFGADHPNVAVRLNNLALVFKATNRVAEAELLMRRALSIAERSFGADGPQVAVCLNNLASLLKAMNRLEEAEALVRRALDIDERSFGADHPEVATDLNNLAQLLQETNRLGEAELLMRRALDMDERTFGTGHPDVAIRLNNLAGLLKATNRLAEAEPLMRRALAIDESSFGPDHPRVAVDLNNLTRFLRASNQLVEAEPLLRRALAIDERNFGADHSNVATRLNNLALLLKATNRLAEAEPLFRRAVTILADVGRRNGYEHPHLRTALDNYAMILRGLGYEPQAIEAKLAELVGEQNLTANDMQSATGTSRG